MKQTLLFLIKRCKNIKHTFLFLKRKCKNMKQILLFLINRCKFMEQTLPFLINRCNDLDGSQKRESEIFLSKRFEWMSIGYDRIGNKLRGSTDDSGFQ